MRKHILILLATLALTPACSKDDKKGSGGGGGAAGGAIKVDQAKLGSECSRSMDCGMLDFEADCRFECSKPTADAANGYCQLINVVATAGTKGCFGNRRGSGTSGSSPDDKTLIVNYCDIDAGVYCDMTTHECVAAKAIGAACKGSDECGKDGACQAGACVAAGAPGGAAVEDRCNASAYRKGDQCIARVADGGVCEESDHCQSLSCVYGTTKACGPSKRKSCSL
jgi:hypothetical protein